MPEPVVTEHKNVCMEEDCLRPMKAFGLCRLHYMRKRRAALAASRPKGVRPKAKPKRRKPPTEVTALYCWPDTNTAAPWGQRLVRYVCPQCHREHLASWMPFDEHPGEKTTLCSIVGSQMGKPVTEVVVLAPPADQHYDEDPAVRTVTLAGGGE